MTEAALFYEAAGSGLGHDFLDDVQHVIDNVMARPEIGILIGHGFRRVLLRRFPFSVVYMMEDREIVVVAVAHQRRRPGYWRGRRGG